MQEAKPMTKNRREIIETDLGDLVLVLTEEASRYIKNEKGAYDAVASILEDLLSKPVSDSWH